jgi:capsular exopolysaccharide synthesis family protein
LPDSEMKFLKTLQKRDSENPVGGEENFADDQDVLVVSSNEPPGLLARPELRIGAPRPSALVVTPADENNGKARVHGNGRPKEIIPVDPATIAPAPAVREITLDVERVNPRLVSITQPRSPYCEEYRNLRTQLLHKSKKRKLQAIVVASAGPSEGKSVTALNLSWLFAQADGVRVLIIDSDLRRPSLAGYLGLDPHHEGLSELLAEDSPLVSRVIRLQPAGLFVLPGGKARSDVAEMLSGPRFAEILSEARAHFDFVIIDAPPLGIFTDASLLINLSDGAMLVIRAGHTKYKDVDRILDSLPRERMLGTVLNQSEVPLMDESYYKYGFYDRDEPVKA